MGQSSYLLRIARHCFKHRSCFIHSSQQVLRAEYYYPPFLAGEVKEFVLLRVGKGSWHRILNYKDGALSQWELHKMSGDSYSVASSGPQVAELNFGAMFLNPEGRAFHY